MKPRRVSWLGFDPSTIPLCPSTPFTWIRLPTLARRVAAFLTEYSVHLRSEPASASDTPTIMGKARRISAVTHCVDQGRVGHRFDSPH
jgi:hypothetical protein